MTKLTAAQRKRLDKLATYLEGLPKRYRHFDMGVWLSGSNEKAVVSYAQKNGGVPSCGTAACAAGHGPAAGILVPPKFIFEFFAGEKRVNWYGYCSLFVGGSGIDAARADTWVFDAGWSSEDNHHWGAAARIRYLLDHGRPPEGFARPARAWRKLYAPYRIDAKQTVSA